MRTIEVLVTEDTKGLDTIMGRALGRPTQVGIHTTLTLDQASAKGHKGQPLSWESLGDTVKWKTKTDYIMSNAGLMKEKHYFDMLKEYENKLYSTKKCNKDEVDE